MTAQPETLRYAAELEACPTINYKPHAAELRRLHQSEREAWRYADELEQERKRLHAEVEEQCRLNAMGQEREARLMAQNNQLLDLLEEAEYALDYASDMTKPEGMSGCDCPICSVSIKIRSVIRARGNDAP